jgi:amino acid transporter
MEHKNQGKAYAGRGKNTNSDIQAPIEVQTESISKEVEEMNEDDRILA